MKNIRPTLLIHFKFLIAIVFLSLSGIPFAQPSRVFDAPLPPLSLMPNPPSGTPIMVGNSGAPIWLELRGDKTFFLQQWNAASGRAASIEIPQKFFPNAVAHTSTGLFIYGGQGEVALQTGDKGWLHADLKVVREQARLLVLHDQSVLLYSGKKVTVTGDTAEAIWSMAIERVSLTNGHVAVELLPDLPGPARNSFAMVNLSDGRVMAVGGAAPHNVGCNPCYAETYILDLTQKRWADGPRLNEARSDASASLLPDGRVMVAGGWRPAGGPTRSVEIWRPTSDAFEPARHLAVASAMHHVQWAPEIFGRQMLLGGGNSNSLQLYDLESEYWRVVGNSCWPEAIGQEVLYPFARDRQAYAWAGKKSSSRPCNSVSTIQAGQWSLSLLSVDTPEGTGPPVVDELFGFPLGRSGVAFAPVKRRNPALLIGGRINTGTNSSEYSAEVDAIWPDGRIQVLPALNQAREGAWALTLDDGSRLVLGGQIVDRDSRDPKSLVPHAEWLPGDLPIELARWIRLDNEPAFLVTRAVGPTFDGHVAVLGDDQIVRLVSILGSGRATEELPRIHTQALPPLLRARRGPISVKGLPDGKVVVAGGQVQVHKIAVAHDRIDRPDTPDEYVGIGEFLPSRSHEIYDPVSSSWRSTSPSRVVSENVVILDDGRVMKIGRVASGNRSRNGIGIESPEDPVIEISNREGTGWTMVDKDLNQRDYVRNAKLVETQGEVFLTEQWNKKHTMGGASFVHWFNAAEMRWEEILKIGPDERWNANDVRIIVRVLPNGKRVVVPVDGH